MRYVALLRGVNVGGKNILPMVRLASMFTNAQCADVQTYIQSGNVVFSANSKLAPKLASNICACIHEEFGFQTNIILRSLPEMEKIAAAIPYSDLDNAHILFLASNPTGEQVAQLDPDRSAPDQFKVIGSEIYLHLPNGTARSKLTNAYFDSKLKTVSTLRNWRTMLKLLAMMAG
jgi:uncharacterized protein (DUF1697 family)